MLPSFSLPALEFCLGTSPIQAEKSLGQRRTDAGDLIEPLARLQLAWPSPPNRVTHGDHGTYVPVEEPSTASEADLIALALWRSVCCFASGMLLRNEVRLKDLCLWPATTPELNAITRFFVAP